MRLLWRCSPETYIIADVAPNLFLIIHNVISIASSVTLFGLALFTFLNGPKRIANIAFSLLMVVVNIFVISHVIGANIADPNFSRTVFMFNLSLFFIGAFFLHAVLAMIGKDHEQLWMIVFVYIASVVFTILFLISPDLFLLPSVPKMYFPNYYNPGSLNIIRLLFTYILIVPYAIYQLYLAYRQSEIDIKRKQYKYFIATAIIGFSVGFIPNFLVYNVQINPLWGMFFGILLAVPFVYGAVRYQMFDIKVIAKQAFLYSILVGLIGGLITLINYSNDWIQAIYPSFPDWITALISAILAVTIGVIVWRKLRRGDLLKYEFITIITHKFRTPLTQIKWSIEELRAEETNQEKLKGFEDLKKFNQKLIDLTSTLVELSDPKNSLDFSQHFEKLSLNDLLKSVSDSYKEIFSKKQIVFSLSCPAYNIMANADKERVKFVIQTLFENAFAYTLPHGKVSFTLESFSDKACISVTDNGIGINKRDLDLIFTRFYRTKNAKIADTEGFGIGLYLARSIARRYKGDLQVFSEGEGKGSTFKFTLPKV